MKEDEKAMLLKALSEAMMREMDYKRKLKIMRDALEKYSAAGHYAARKALAEVDFSFETTDQYPPQGVQPQGDEINAV